MRTEVRRRRGRLSLPAERMWRVPTDAADPRLGDELLSQVVACLWLPPGLERAARDRRVEAALEALRAMAPRDVVEALAAAQMVGLHGAAMESLRRAMAPEQDETVRERELRQAARLIGVYARQAEGLSRNRVRHPQQQVVEKVIKLEWDDPRTEPREPTWRDEEDDPYDRDG